MFEGVELKPALRGNQVTVVVDEVDGGNYSCHSADGQYLNHTVVFVQVEKENVILKNMSTEEGKFRKDECAICAFEGWFGSNSSACSSRVHPMLCAQLHRPVLLFLVQSGHQIQRCRVSTQGKTVTLIPLFSAHQLVL